ncbi:MAG: OadG family protein [Bacteroidaceae bacterium]|nr:OadG family protein [Bacteroidaceae bacterium]
MENLGIGFELMIVGMCTVFLILLIVINGGKLLIKVVNRIAPEEVKAAKQTVAEQSGNVDPSTMAVLSEVVKQLTQGKGRITSVKKI